MSVRDENGKLTSITRDGNHRITRIDYPQDANTPPPPRNSKNTTIWAIPSSSLRNGAYERFGSGGRGLLIDKYNPKFGGPRRHRSAHPLRLLHVAALGLDRVKTVTMPPNFRLVIRLPRPTNMTWIPAGQPCAGRGLITKNHLC